MVYKLLPPPEKKKKHQMSWVSLVSLFCHNFCELYPSNILRCLRVFFKDFGAPTELGSTVFSMVFSDCVFFQDGVLQRHSIWTFLLTCLSEIFFFGTTFKNWFWRLTFHMTEIWSLQVFNKSFRYQTSRYCISLVRLFWDWGFPYLSRIHTSLYMVRIPLF